MTGCAIPPSEATAFAHYNSTRTEAELTIERDRLQATHNDLSAIHSRVKDQSQRVNDLQLELRDTLQHHVTFLENSNKRHDEFMNGIRENMRKRQEESEKFEEEQRPIREKIRLDREDLERMQEEFRKKHEPVIETVAEPVVVEKVEVVEQPKEEVKQPTIHDVGFFRWLFKMLADMFSRITGSFTARSVTRITP
jgi:seryl-tRNA synthetase